MRLIMIKKLMLLSIILCFCIALSYATKVTLTWNASPTPGVSYNVYRTTVAGSCKTTQLTSGITTLTYDDTVIVPGTTYYYTVSAQNLGGESTCTNEVQIAVPPIPLPPSNLQGKVN